MKNGYNNNNKFYKKNKNSNNKNNMKNNDNNKNKEQKVDNNKNNNQPEQKGFKGLKPNFIGDGIYEMKIEKRKENGKEGYFVVQKSFKEKKLSKEQQKEINEKNKKLLDEKRLIHFKGNKNNKDKKFDNEQLVVSGYNNNYVELKDEKQFREKNKNIELKQMGKLKEGEKPIKFVYYTENKNPDKSKAPHVEYKGYVSNDLLKNYNLYQSLLPLLEEALRGESALNSINIMYKIYKEVVEFNDKFEQSQKLLEIDNDKDNKDIKKDNNKDKNKPEELKKIEEEKIKEAKDFIEQNKEFYNKIHKKDSRLLTKNLIKKMKKLYEDKISKEYRQKLDKNIKKIVEQKKALKKNNGLVIPQLGIGQKMSEEQLLNGIEELQGQLDKLQCKLNGSNDKDKKGYAFGKKENDVRAWNAKLFRNEQEIKQCEEKLKKNSALILSYKEQIKVLEEKKDKTKEEQKKIKFLEERIQKTEEKMLDIAAKKTSLEKQVEKDQEEKKEAAAKFEAEQRKKQEAVKKELDEKIEQLGGKEGIIIAKLNRTCKDPNITFYTKKQLEEVIKKQLQDKKDKKQEVNDELVQEIRKEYFDKYKAYCEKHKKSLIPLFNDNEEDYKNFVENYYKPEVKQEQNNKKGQLQPKINSNQSDNKQNPTNNNKVNNKHNISNYKKKNLLNNKNIIGNLQKKNKFKNNQNNINIK